jgi:tripartite-type tricarboxylate transporter receptor subunit TctC
VLAPAGTPVAVIAKAYDPLVRTAAGAGLREQLVDMGREPIVNTPESCGSEITADVARWAQAVRDGRLRLE